MAAAEQPGRASTSEVGFHLAALYARVSTTDQTVETQLSALQREAARLGFIVAGDAIYADSAVSGRLDSRPQFDRLRADVRARRFVAVFVTKLDRIARSVQTALAFFDEAEAAGVRIIVTDQAIDTGTPVGRLTRTILAAVAEFEGDLIRERTQVAMDAIRSGARPTRSGRPVGRPRRVTPEIVERIRAFRAQSLTWNETARRVGLPAETCRKAVWVRKGGALRVENAAAGFTRPGPGEEPRQ